MVLRWLRSGTTTTLEERGVEFRQRTADPGANPQKRKKRKKENTPRLWFSQLHYEPLGGNVGPGKENT